MRQFVYLSGPIKHFTYADANAWREQAAAAFLPGIIGINPLRGKEFLANEGVMGEDVLRKHFDQPFIKDAELVSRDHHDVINANALLVNLLGTTKVSIGTMAEMAWAYDRQIKMCLVMEETGNVHEHPFIRGMAHFRATTLADGISKINALLGPYATA